MTEDDGGEGIFLYMGKHGGEVPLDVKCVRVHESVRRIHGRAFYCRSQLRTVTGGDGLEEIGYSSFARCESLCGITISPNVRVIEKYAFTHCSQLKTVNGGEGIKEIGPNAFWKCTFLEEITIYPSVEVIHNYAFNECRGLRIVNGGEGLVEIGKEAFSTCYILQEITIYPSVKVIKDYAFVYCSGLTTVNGGEGLVEIREGAFKHCTSLREITISPTVKVIREEAFRMCQQLTNVNLSMGLRKIEQKAFARCALLQNLIIPSTVKVIESGAFISCASLTSVVFCNEIQEFVSKLTWWNKGIHKKSTRTYCFFVKHKIPQRLKDLRPLNWRQADIIYDMLNRIPSISNKCLESNYFETIHRKLQLYESLMHVFSLVKLSLWRSICMKEILRESNGSITVKRLKMLCRIDATKLLNQIVPHVIPFLIDENDGRNVVDNGRLDLDTGSSDSGDY